MEILGGPLFAVAGGGESHGPAIVTIVFGCPAGLYLERSRIQSFLDRRRPGASKHGTTRREGDKIALLSGIYSDDHSELLTGPPISFDSSLGQGVCTYESGFSTGEPISSVVFSTATRSGDYEQFRGEKGAVRPGHTDLVKYHKSSGHIDIRGSGRSSYRSTISDVIGGSIARIFLREKFGTTILSSICQVGTLKADQLLSSKLENFKSRPSADLLDKKINLLEQELNSNQIHSLDPKFSVEAAELIRKTRVEGDSLGAVIEIVVVKPPPLLGEPLFNSLKLRILGSLGGVHAVQACEIGKGFSVAELKGSENNDPIRSSGYQSNSHGGLIGGITTGMPIACRVAFKPTSSIPRLQKSIRKNLKNHDFHLQRGRHDPCVGIRAGITLESRVAIELMNALLCHQAGQLHIEDFKLF